MPFPPPVTMTVRPVKSKRSFMLVSRKKAGRYTRHGPCATAGFQRAWRSPGPRFVATDVAFLHHRAINLAFSDQILGGSPQHLAYFRANVRRPESRGFLGDESHGAQIQSSGLDGLDHVERLRVGDGAGG